MMYVSPFIFYLVAVILVIMLLVLFILCVLAFILIGTVRHYIVHRIDDKEASRIVK